MERQVAPSVSVVLCTFNPRREIFAQVLDALDRQTLAKDRFEVVIVDNNSSPPLDRQQLLQGRSFNLRLITETQQGLNNARLAGIPAAQASLLVLVDDDNILDADYLQYAVDIAQAHPQIGAFGGISRGKLEVRSVAAWKQRLLPFLGIRDYGPEPITSREEKWGHWEPIGAGMVVRKQVAEQFIRMVQSMSGAARLGRSGKALLSGEDSLLARASYRLGLACSYQPALKLDHYMYRQRLRTKYLARIMVGHGRSYVILHTALGENLPKLSAPELLLRLFFRIRKEGWSGIFWWCWDVGYYQERRQLDRQRQEH